MSKNEEVDKRLLSKSWRLNNLYKITNKQGQLITFGENDVQKDFNAAAHTRNLILKSRQHGFCLDPNTLVLTANLEWVKISELPVGQDIISVDEYPTRGRGCGRRMLTAKVNAVVFVNRLAYKITLDNGKEVICSSQHPWLSKKIGCEPQWRSIEPRSDYNGLLKVGTKIRYITDVWGESNFDDGWIGGILDGEGSITKYGAKRSVAIGISQRAGKVLDRVKRYLDNNNYHYRIDEDKRPAGNGKFGSKSVYRVELTRMDEIFRLIGKTRPSRFLNNRFWEGRELPGKKTSVGWVKISKIEKLGMCDLVDLQTSAGTYIADGLVSHNTTDIDLGS